MIFCNASTSERSNAAVRASSTAMTSFSVWLAPAGPGAANAALAPNTRPNKKRDFFTSSSPSLSPLDSKAAKSGTTMNILLVPILTFDNRRRGIIIGMFLARGLRVFAVFAISAIVHAQDLGAVAPTPATERTARLIGILPEVTQLQKLSAG